jgi:uncharacterized protein YbjT (DUF2867 family)
MIIVTGANGKLGRAIAERLLEHVAAANVGVTVRNPEKAGDLQQRGVRVRRGDFDDAASLAHAFEGASQVLIVSVDRHGETAVRAHMTAIESAKAAGAGRILYTSHMGSSPTSHFAPMRDHAATEAALMSSGVPFTALRNGFYAESAVQILGAAPKTGEAAAPEDGSISWTAHADLADAAVAALTREGLDGITPALTGSKAVDLAGLAAIASELARRPIRRIVVTEAEHRQSLIAHNVPEVHRTPVELTP